MKYRQVVSEALDSLYFIIYCTMIRLRFNETLVKSVMKPENRNKLFQNLYMFGS